jgi:hypothetical protein
METRGDGVDVCMCWVCDSVNSNREGRRVMERRGVMESGSKDETKRRRGMDVHTTLCPL